MTQVQLLSWEFCQIFKKTVFVHVIKHANFSFTGHTLTELFGKLMIGEKYI